MNAVKSSWAISHVSVVLKTNTLETSSVCIIRVDPDFIECIYVFLSRIWKQAVMAYVKLHVPSTCLEGHVQFMENLSQESCLHRLRFQVVTSECGRSSKHYAWNVQFLHMILDCVLCFVIFLYLLSFRQVCNALVNTNRTLTSHNILHYYQHG